MKLELESILRSEKKVTSEDSIKSSCNVEVESTIGWSVEIIGEEIGWSVEIAGEEIGWGVEIVGEEDDLVKEGRRSGEIFLIIIERAEKGTILVNLNKNEVESGGC